MPARIFRPEDFGDEVLARRLRQVPWDGLSFTLPGEPALVVLLNPHRPATRRTATLMEELAHALLEHRPSRLEPDPATGVLRRSYDAAQEREAFEFGATLLLPRDLLAAELRARPLGVPPPPGATAAARRWCCSGSAASGSRGATTPTRSRPSRGTRSASGPAASASARPT